MSLGGFPAPAGIDPTETGYPSAYRGLPRTRGDRPIPEAMIDRAFSASPHPRG